MCQDSLILGECSYKSADCAFIMIVLLLVFRLRFYKTLKNCIEVWYEYFTTKEYTVYWEIIFKKTLKYQSTQTTGRTDIGHKEYQQFLLQ